MVRRRQLIKASGLGVLGSAFLARVDKVAAAQPSSLRSLLAEQAKAGNSARLLLSPAHAGARCGPRNRRPGRSPVASSSCRTTSPRFTVAR